tara:strand:- start:168 stop:413 length:246 start_codon:yes stop_codon:yes gene_type:complete
MCKSDVRVEIKKLRRGTLFFLVPFVRSLKFLLFFLKPKNFRIQSEFIKAFNKALFEISPSILKPKNFRQKKRIQSVQLKAL